MSLMKLSPETVRLRRIAKAHAAGEFTLAEYRQARREVIANFEPDAHGEDDTQPRFLADIAPRRALPAAAEPSRGGRGWLVLLLACVSLLAAAHVLGATPAIPPVAERDPNPLTSPRLPVDRVVVADAPALAGIDPAHAQALADAALAEVRARNRPDQHGFTPAELEELGRFLNALGAHDEAVALDAQDARDLTELLRTQKLRRGISVVELEQVAGAVQKHYRDAGYALAVAYLPSQEIVEGTAQIAVLPGVLGEIDVRGGSPRVADRFRDLMGKPLDARQVATRLYALNQAPGFLAQASFEPGDVVGETRMHLDVVEESTWRTGIGLDNHGDEETGQQRLVATGNWANPLNRGDALTLGLIAALNPSNQLYGFVGYETPMGARHQVLARLQSNDFATSGIDATDGDGVLLDFAVERFLYRDRRLGLSFDLGAGLHRLEWEGESGGLDQQARFLGAALNGRRVWDSLRLAAEARLYADVGRLDETFVGQDDAFWDAGLTLSAWRPFDLPALPGRQQVALSLHGQLSGSQLPSSKRLGLAGAGAARGFDRNLFVADQGVLVRLDLRTALPIGDLVLFADAGYGDSRNEIEPAWARLADLGLAWEAPLGARLVSRLSGAVPVMVDGTGGLEDDGVRIFWSLQYAY